MNILTFSLGTPASLRQLKCKNKSPKGGLGWTVKNHQSFSFPFVPSISIQRTTESTLLIRLYPFFLICMVTDWRYVFVADFEALSCQVTRKFIRCRNAEIPTISAIKYTACYALAVLVCQVVMSFHFCWYCHNLLSVVGLCVSVFKIFWREGDFINTIFLGLMKSILFLQLWLVCLD